MTTLALVLLGIVVCLLLVDLGVHLFYAWSALPFVESGPMFIVAPPADVGIVPEPVQIPTSDGLLLRGGVYYPPTGMPKGVVVFCPETYASFATAMNYASPLVEAGFAVVSISFRNHATSDSLQTYRATHWLSDYEVADVTAVLDFVAAQPQFTGLPVGLFGVSRGAGAALAAGAQRPEVRAAWAQGLFSTHGLMRHFSMRWAASVVGNRISMIPRWHILVTMWFTLKFVERKNRCHYPRLESLLPKWKGREVQVVRGARDNYVPFELSAELCRLTGRSEETSLWTVPRAKHNRERLVNPEEFDIRLLQFFEGMLPEEAIYREYEGRFPVAALRAQPLPVPLKS